MTTSDLDATQHHWVQSLARFTFSIEYLKGWDNAATLKLDAETVKSILNGVTMGMTERARHPPEPTSQVGEFQEDGRGHLYKG